MFHKGKIARTNSVARAGERYLGSDTHSDHSVVSAMASIGSTVHVVVLQCPQVLCSKTGRKRLCYLLSSDNSSPCSTQNQILRNAFDDLCQFVDSNLILLTQRQLFISFLLIKFWEA